MKAEQSAGAASDISGHWRELNWRSITGEVRRLQVRIVKAVETGRCHTRDYDRWLDREATEQLPIDLLRPFESEEMKVYEANPKVGNVRNNGPEMMRAAAKAAEAGDLPL